MSDVIEDFIKQMFEDEDVIEIQRNDLAQHFNCVPSQINYVIATDLNHHKVIMQKAEEVEEVTLKQKKLM